jgi:hypothetical protein
MMIDKCHVESLLVKTPTKDIVAIMEKQDRRFFEGWKVGKPLTPGPAL